MWKEVTECLAVGGGWFARFVDMILFESRIARIARITRIVWDFGWVTDAECFLSESRITLIARITRIVWVFS